jgi:hypothetical protein
MLFTPRRQQQALKYSSQTDEANMQIRMDKSLREYADQAYEAARLRRNGAHATPDLVLAAMLADFEAAGDAMRYVNSHGQIAWKATPQLRDYLMDLQLDAEADLEDV